MRQFAAIRQESYIPISHIYVCTLLVTFFYISIQLILFIQYTPIVSALYRFDKDYFAKVNIIFKSVKYFIKNHFILLFDTYHTALLSICILILFTLFYFDIAQTIVIFDFQQE